MDVFDGEPYAELLPRWLTRALGWALLLAVAFVPVAREWLIAQAQAHVVHEIQPLLDNLSGSPEPAPVSSRP